MKFSLDRLITKLTGRNWNYFITFVYYMAPGEINSGSATKSMTFSVKDRNVLGNHRLLKKELMPRFVIDLPKHCRTNGSMEVQSITYVGWFKPTERKNPKTGKIGHKKPWYRT